MAITLRKPDRGERAVRFLRRLKHPKSTAPDKAFQLDAWMESIVRRIYAPVDAHGQRIIRNVIILLPRGNRKTTLGAALAVLHSYGPERVFGSEVLLAASDRKQAKIAYAECGMVLQASYPEQFTSGHKNFVGTNKAEIRLKDYTNQIAFRDAIKLEALSSDAGTQHGRTPAFTLVDEIHAWKKRDLWDVIRTGLVKTPGSLLVVITTSGRGQDNLAAEIIDYARKVARGEIDDPATLPILFETPATADWKDESVWHAVNPGLSCNPPYPDLYGLRQLAREAEARPADRDAFKQLHLNQWLDHSASPFVEMQVYDLGSDPVDLDEMKGLPCWLGVDLSSSGDLTCVVACWRDGEDYHVHPWFFCPAENLLKRQDVSGQPYLQWRDDERIIATDGDVVDLNTVEAVIRGLCDRFDVREVAFDPALSHGVMGRLGEDGYPVVQVRQGALTMMPLIATTERVILGRNLTHGGHPILRHHFSNVETEMNAHGHKIRLKKSTRHLCIDGAVATTMAVGRAAMGEDNRSVYADADARPSGLMVW